MFAKTSIQGLKVLAAAAVAATMGCAQVEAEVPEAKVTQKGVSFYGTGLGGQDGIGEVSGTQTFVLDADNLSWVKELNSKVYLTEIDLLATSGVTDLGFIRYARVTMADADKTEQQIELVNYARSENRAASPELVAPTPYPIDISEIWSAKRLAVTVSVAGTLPDKNWSVDITLRLSGKISYKL